MANIRYKYIPNPILEFNVDPARMLEIVHAMNHFCIGLEWSEKEFEIINQATGIIEDIMGQTNAAEVYGK